MKKQWYVYLILMAAVALAPATASAVDFGIYGSAIDTSDLSEAFGGGLRIAFPVTTNLDIDASATYFEDFSNKFESVNDPSKIELGFIPVDIGVLWKMNEDGGFVAGGGGTYAWADFNDLEINSVDLVRIRGEANDEFGFYVKAGYQARSNGFFAELLYRWLEITVDELSVVQGNFVLPVSRAIDIDMDGWQANVGWRFGK